MTFAPTKPALEAAKEVPPDGHGNIGESPVCLYTEYGEWAFGNPRAAAAWHEAGHAVIFMCEGFEVREIRLSPRFENGRRGWTGKTSGAVPWRGIHYPHGPCLEDDLRHARILAAGTISGILFDKQNFRTEIGAPLADLFFNDAAGWRGVSPGVIFDEVYQAVTRMLNERQECVGRIAAELIGVKCLKGRRLERFLEGMAR